MSVHINFNLEHRFFSDSLRVGVEWNFPFLPRIGEHINGWIWIEQLEFGREQIEELLTSAGQQSLEKFCIGKLTLNDWLYEVGMECDTVYDLAYYQSRNNPHEIYVELYMREMR